MRTKHVAGCAGVLLRLMAPVRMGRLLLPALLLGSSAGGETMVHDGDEHFSARFAQLALDCVHREYPNKIGHLMNSDADIGVPHVLTPVFFGCYDWHSAVHGHWLLARLARLNPGAAYTPAALAALDRSFTKANVEGELRYLGAEGRVSFERPYGLAWLLQLGAELREWEDNRAKSWVETLQPLEQLASERIASWLPKLDYPIRIGEHSQTAFAFGLLLDWARIATDVKMEQLLIARSRHYYLGDQGCPMSWEPSGHDFLSPCLAEADLMRRVLDQAEFSSWLTGFLPDIPHDGGASWLEPAIVSDREDPKLAHLDGLNLSRAWMLEGIAAALPADDSRLPAVKAAAAAHKRLGLEAVNADHYVGSHWLGSFAAYLVTGRGLASQ